MIKHVGKHNQKKCILLFREVPDETHMCLVVFSDMLPQMIHDEVMKTLESAAGQESSNLADALFRNVMADGNNTLTSLHKMGLIKKIPTNQVLVTPNAKSSVRLDELNKLLNEMTLGKDAAKKYADIDSKESNKKKTVDRDVGEPSRLEASVADVLSDSDLARQRLDQANRMKADAARLLAEAENLIAEAVSLDPKVNEPAAKKKTTTKVKKG